MHPIKIVEVAKSRELGLSLQQIKNYMQRKNIEILIDKIEFNDEHDIFPMLQKALVGATAARIEPELSTYFIDQFGALPTEVSALQCADCLLYEQGKWWPRILIQESLRNLIVKKAKHLDIRESAYVIASGANMRIIASVLLKFGFSKVCLVGENPDDLENQYQKLSKLFVGSEIEKVLSHTLTMQGVNASLLVNAMDLKKNPNLANDIAYFNFLRKGSLVIDCNLFPLLNPVMDEAQRAGFKCVPAHEMTAHTDGIFIDKIGLGEHFRQMEYSFSWMGFLNTQSNEPS